MRKHHFKDEERHKMKTFKNLKMWRGRHNEDHDTSLWFVIWRLHNVQTKIASHHADMSVKYCFKTSSWNARMHNDKE